MRSLIYECNGVDVEMGISPFSIVSVGGLGYRNDNYLYQAIYQDGKTFINSNLQMRNIVIDLKITKDYDLNKQRLTKCFNPKKEGVLTISDGNIKRKTYCRVESVDFGKTSRDNKVMISLLCPSPFFYGSKEELLSLAKWEEAFHFPVVYGNPAEPVLFGKRVSNKIVNLYNDGDVSTSVIIEMKANGRVVNPQITKISTAEEFKILTTMENNDIIIIDTKNKRVQKNEENIYNLRARGSKFFNLDIGDNVITYNCDSGDESLDITIRYENAYITV